MDLLLERSDVRAENDLGGADVLRLFRTFLSASEGRVGAIMMRQLVD
jgi:hypothetical protein